MRRIGDLLPLGGPVAAGSYRIRFDTASYARRCAALHPSAFPAAPFYPCAVVYFDIAPSQVRVAGVLRACARAAGVQARL